MAGAYAYTEMTAEYESLLTKDDAAVFLYYRNDQPVAFAQCQLRYDYAEGTRTSPVGYPEGMGSFKSCLFVRGPFHSVIVKLNS